MALNCKMAIVAKDNLIEIQQIFPSGSGVRVINGNHANRELKVLYSKWLNIDILISFADKNSLDIAYLVSDIISTLPSPSFYHPRMITLCKNGIKIYPLPLSDLPLPESSTLSITAYCLNAILFVSAETETSISEIIF
ncbi:MAG: hypothetical protein NC328_05795 [Muribaculum sp.]|nr:hypothetical protein [Muribaculum sp.]